MLETISDMISLAVLLLVTFMSLIFLIRILTGMKKRKKQVLLHDYYAHFKDECTADDSDVLYIPNKTKQGGEL